MKSHELLDPSLRELTGYSEPEDIKRFLFIQKWMERLGAPNTVRVLDVGCGNGHISRGLAKLGCNVLGIDIDENSIKKAREEAGSLADFEVLDVADLEAKTGIAHFDMIICSEVLEHLEDPGSMIGHLFPCLKEGGILIVTTPNGFGPRETTVTKPVQKLYKLGFGKAIMLLKRMMGYKGATSQSSNPDLTHIQFFTDTELKQVVGGKHDLKLEEFGNANYLEKSFPYSLIYKGNMAKKAADCIAADGIPNAKASGWNTAWRKSSK